MMQLKSNPQTQQLVKALYAKNGRLWKRLAQRLEKPNSTWAEINLSRLNRVTKAGETIVVPGKILGAGQISHKLNVYAFNATATARDAIETAGGVYYSLDSLLEKESKEVRIIQ